MHGFGRAAVMMVVAGLVARANAGPVRELTRRLTPAEAAQPQKIADAFVAAIVDAGHRAGHDCRLSSIVGGTGTPRITRALAVPGGLAPNFGGLTLHCDETPGDYSYPSVSLDVALDPEPRASLRPPKTVPGAPGRLRWTAKGRERLYLERDVADGGVATAAIRITVSAGQPMGLLDALAAPELEHLVEGVALLPAPVRPPPPPNFDADSALIVVSRSEEERKVVSAIMAEVAGKGARIILRKTPHRDAATFDATSLATLGVATPDLDPELLPKFEAKRTRGLLPAVPYGVLVVDDATLDAAFERGFWTEFHRRYPDTTGILRLSPIVFGNGGGQAAVTVGWQRGPLDGIGALYVLQRDSAGAWTIIYEAILWRS